MNTEKVYVIGTDFGTSSVRSILVDANSGEEITSSEFVYPRWKKGNYCDAAKNQFRQHPLDYLEGLEHTIRSLVKDIGENANSIKAITIGATGSTPVAVDVKGLPLALHPEFEDNPNAMFFLWKDHTASKEAAEINAKAEKFDTDYLKYVGGIYSSEWYWAKLLYALRKDSAVKTACHSWVEHSDWIPFLLTGKQEVSQMKRNVCAAGHKGLWAREFGGFPPEDFFAEIDPGLLKIRQGLPEKTYTAAEAAGQLSEEWAKSLGLSTKVQVGIGAIDAHLGAVGSQIKPYYLSKVMGTSTCDMMVMPSKKMEGLFVKGIAGQVEGSIIPGMVGMEAGQSAFGDIFAWYADLLTWSLKTILPNLEMLDEKKAHEISENLRENILSELGQKASKIALHENNELSVDWLNGRRTPDANPLLKGAIQGLTLGSTAPGIYRSLVEATCFGAREIIERFREEGIPVKGLIGVGGVAKKSSYIMQVMANVLGMPIKIHNSEQTSALGAAMFAATVAGIYPRVEDAMNKMGQGFGEEFKPDFEKSKIYNERYRKYKNLSAFVEKDASF